MTISIRPALPADAARCAAIYRPFVTDNWVSFETDPPDEAEMAARIKAYAASHAWLVAQAPDGAIAGYAYGSPHRTRAAYATSADVAVYVDPAFARAGDRPGALWRALPAAARQGHPRRLCRHCAPQSGQHRAPRGQSASRLSASIAKSAGRWTAGAMSAGGSGCSRRPRRPAQRPIMCQPSAPMPRRPAGRATDRPRAAASGRHSPAESVPRM